MNKQTSWAIGLIFIFAIFWFIKEATSTWTGFYYPNENNLYRYIKSPELKSLDECREWIDGQIDKYNPSGYGYDYECGKNCKLSEHETNIYHCEEDSE